MTTRMMTKALATAGAAAVLMGVAVTPAQAASTCSSWKTTEVRTALPDLYGVGARCSALDWNYKARGGLDVYYDFDVYTSWFTRLNTSYYSSSKRAYAGGTYHEVRPI